MRLVGVEAIRVAMPLVTPFRTSFGTETARDVLLQRPAKAASQRSASPLPARSLDQDEAAPPVGRVVRRADHEVVAAVLDQRSAGLEQGEVGPVRQADHVHARTVRAGGPRVRP